MTVAILLAGPMALAQESRSLELPTGRTYRARTVDKNLVVRDQGGNATVVQDELQNTDQLGVEFPAARKLLVKQNRRGIERMRLIVQDSNIAAPASCDVDGALLIDREGVLPGMRIFLEADRWRPIAKGRPERGCVYRSSRSPVRFVRVKAGKTITVKAKDGRLDEGIPLGSESSPEDPRPVRIELRHGDVRHCIEFGGATGTYKPGRKLVARDAEPATSCPTVE